MTMALCSCSVMGSIMRWDMGGVILIYGYTMFFEYLLIRTRAREGTYGSSMFFGFCADLLSESDLVNHEAYVRIVKRSMILAAISWGQQRNSRFVTSKLPILVLFLL